ncbi:MAG: D-alanine--D-alanine ligase [Candidatus Pacebacteria bacterium]|nr:D-alanine--D-alanine ligase [Candidatus Paceibacterota bacterium]
MKRINIGIIFGGKSAEHEVSLQSAKNVVAALDKEKYNPILIGIDKSGKWLGSEKAQLLIENRSPNLIQNETITSNETAILPTQEMLGAGKIDVAFPVLHGTFGEDGTVQGLLKLAGIPFVGASVLGSAVGMDKDVMKRLLRDAGLPIANFLVYTGLTGVNFEVVVNELGLPFFVKPCNLGSSVGVFKVHNKQEFETAIKGAFEYDNKIIIEENIMGREVECSVLGNENPIASLPGEVVPQHEFYSYEAKYLDENGALLKIPADLPKETIKKVRELAVETYKVLCCEGMGRVDLFVKSNGEVLVNEINTIPGFTKISMYPKLWEKSGISYTELLDKLIQLAIDRFDKEQKLKTSY